MLAKLTKTNSNKVSCLMTANSILHEIILVLLSSQLFDFTDQDVDLKIFDYMKLLDTDKDNHIGFFDFLQPIINVVPPEVITAFTQDQRFR